MLEIKNLHFRYSKQLPEVLCGIDLTLEKGEIGILLGKNGAGKSTLFKTILGIERPSSGSVELNSVLLNSVSPAQRAKYIAYVPQNVTFGDLSVFDTVMTGRISYFGVKAGKEDYDAVRAALDEMGLSGFADRSADRLSGGEKQKVAIARAIVGNPRLIIFDEPTGNLDLANERLLIEEAEKLAKTYGISILCSLHDLNEAAELGDKFFFMKDGAIRYAGGKELFTEDVIEDIYGVRVRVNHIGNQILITGGTSK
ncbi:MAG: ABC transporter ATP-binding protein [Eubacteriales bacterium]|nr:ABC transporter ATP-binding protein [Eubacteriales bacterium]